MTPIVKIPPIFEDEQEKIIYEALENGYTTIDMLLGTTNIPMTEILTTLAML